MSSSLRSSKHLIKNALKNNDFLKNLDKSQVHEIVSCMHEVTYRQGDFIVREHEGGNHFYVSAGGCQCPLSISIPLSPICAEL